MTYSDEEHIASFFQNNPNNLSGKGKMLLWIIELHMELHHYMKDTLPTEEIHTQGSKVNQVLGAD